MFTTRRPNSHLNIADYNVLLYHDYESNLDFKKNYFLSQSPRPMSYRDLRTFMSNLNPSNVVVLTEPSNSPDTLKRSSSSARNHRKQSSRKKKHKHQSVDVYRALARPESRISTLNDRNPNNDEMILLANSFVIDHMSSSPTSGFFHPQNLPNIQKHRLNNNRLKSRQSLSPTCHFQQNRSTKPTHVDIHYDKNSTNKSNRIEISRTKSTLLSNSSSRIQQIIHAKPTPPEVIHRTTPVDSQYMKNIDEIVTTTVNYIPRSQSQTRKQLHVYMPEIVLC